MRNIAMEKALSNGIVGMIFLAVKNPDG